MNQEEIKKYTGKHVTINGMGDLGMIKFWRNHIYQETIFKIEGLTKGGMAVLQCDPEILRKMGKHALSIPPKNLTLVNKMRTENVCLFDLDGTLADFDKQMKHDMALLRGPSEEIINPWDKSKWWIRNRKRLIMQKPGWWRNLPKHQPGFDIFKIAQDLDFEIHVLTKGPSASTSAWGEKIEWCKKYLPENTKITLTEDKGLVYGKMLVDDWPEYVDRWLEWRPRGLVIMPAHEHNKNYIHKNVIRYDGSNISEVKRRMLETMIRNPGKEIGE